MCTAGALNKRYLFKNRDMGLLAGKEESIVRGQGLYRYIGVAGHATPNERGLNSGINEAGVSVEMTFVGKESLLELIDTRISRGILIESILREASNLNEALDIAVRLLNKYKFVSGNILINTREGSAIIEELYPRYSIERLDSDEHSWIVKTNHFDNLILPEGYLPEINNSKTRNARFRELLNNIDAKSAKPEDIRLALSDHENGKDAICRHGEKQGAFTVSSVVYDIENTKMYYIYGTPCDHQYTTYEI